MNTLTNLPHLPTELWDKIFDIKWAMEDKESMKKHNDYHKPLLEEFKKECIIVDELKHGNFYYDNTTFIDTFFHYWADEHWKIVNNKKITSDYYFNNEHFNNEHEWMSDDSDDDDEYWSEEDADYDLL